MPLWKIENIRNINRCLVEGKTSPRYSWDEPIPEGFGFELRFHNMFD